MFTCANPRQDISWTTLLEIFVNLHSQKKHVMAWNSVKKYNNYASGRMIAGSAPISLPTANA